MKIERARRARRGCFAGVGCVAIVVLLLATAAPASILSGQTLDEVLEPIGVLRLEETSRALVADPHLRLDPRGGWIYWDRQEMQVRLYGEDGSLERVIGREGEGPGEFRGIVGAARIGSGELVTLDGRGQVAVWSEEGDFLLSEFASGIHRPEGLAAAGEHTVVVAAKPRIEDPDELSSPILRRVDVATGERAASFLGLPLTEENVTAALSVEYPPPVVRRDSVFAASAVFDSLWAMPLDGRGGPRALAVPSELLRASLPPAGRSEGPQAVREWLRQATFLGPFTPLPGGGWLVQLWSLRGGDDGAFFSLVRIDDHGDLLWEVHETPRLLEVDTVSGRIYLWDPGGPDPAAIQVARLR